MSMQEQPMSLEEFYDAMEKTTTPTATKPTTVMSPHKDMISYYDIEKNHLVDIDLKKECKVPYKVPIYACLSTETNKVKFISILKESFPKYIEEKIYSTKYSPTIDIHVIYRSVRANEKVVDILNTIIHTVARWSDAQYYPVRNIDAFSKYMANELDHSDQIVHKHKCILLRTKSFVLPTGDMSIPGLPVIWSFDGSYVDPKSKDTVFTYTVEQAYSYDPDRPGLMLEENQILHRYAATMNDIIGILEDPDSSTLLLFESTELFKFVKKEINVLFEDLNIQPIAVME